MRKELKNKNTIVNIFLANIFCNNKDFSSYKKLEESYKNNVDKNQFETPKRCSVKNGDKAQDIETTITQNKYEVLSNPDESDINGCNNDNDQLIISRHETPNDNKKISNTFYVYFTNITKDLNLRESAENINFENEGSCKKIKVTKGFLLKLFPRKIFHI